MAWWNVKGLYVTYFQTGPNGIVTLGMELVRSGGTALGITRYDLLIS